MSQQPSLAQELLKQLQGTPMQEMSQQLGVNTQQIQSAVGAAVPLLLGALGKNASQAQGAADLFSALQRDHAQTMPQGLGDLGSLLGAVLGGGASQSAAGNGAAILGHIFGNSRQQAEAGLGQATGLGDKAGQLLSILAPIVMAFLANRVQAGQMDASTLGLRWSRSAHRCSSRVAWAAVCWAACWTRTAMASWTWAICSSWAAAF